MNEHVVRTFSQQCSEVALNLGKINYDMKTMSSTQWPAAEKSTMIPRCFNRGRQTAVVNQGFAWKVLQAVISLRETDLVCEVTQSLTWETSWSWCSSLSASCLFLVSDFRLWPGSACLFVVIFFPVASLWPRSTNGRPLDSPSCTSRAGSRTSIWLLQFPPSLK